MRFGKKSFNVFTGLVLVGAALACGPFYSHRVMDYEAMIIQPIPGQAELLFPKNEVAHERNRYLNMLDGRRKATLLADIQDLKKAAPNLDEKVLKAYEKIRGEMLSGVYFFSEKEQQEQVNKWTNDDLLKALPKEFSLYLKGALLYRRGHLEGAREHWEELLALPKEERKYRSVWAAWMLARTTTEKGEPLAMYQKILKMVEGGMPDSLDVTKDKEGWKGYFGYRGGDYLPALRNYIKQGKSNQISAREARDSVNTVLTLATKKRTFFTDAAKDRDIRFAVTCYIDGQIFSYNAHKLNQKVEVDKSRVDYIREWVKTMEENTSDDLSRELSTLAASAYKLHAFELADELLKKVVEQRPSTVWVRAKLASYRGDLNEASKLYAKLIPLLEAESNTGKNQLKKDDPKKHTYHEGIFQSFTELYYMGENLATLTSLAYAEYGAIELGLKRYQHAMDLFILAGAREDAAYIAENVLSPKELLEHVRKSSVTQNEEWLKELLGRKLARADMFKDAREFIPQTQVKAFDKYVDLYRYATNEKNPVDKRAESLNKASQLRRNDRLFSVENRSRPATRIYGAGEKYAETHDHYEASENLYPKMSQDEIARVKKYYKRYGKVRVAALDAAELQYKAALLLPNHNDKAATWLNSAGLDTMLDPTYADKYYKTLVRKHWKTALGKYADHRRWFVPSNVDHIERLKLIEEEKKKLLEKVDEIWKDDLPEKVEKPKLSE